MTHTKEIVKINTFYASSCSGRTSTVFSLWGFHWSNIAQNRTKFTWLLLVLAPPINKMCSAWETDPEWRNSTCKTAELLHIDTIPWSICWARTGQSTTPGNRALTWLFTVTLFSHISNWTQKKSLLGRRTNEWRPSPENRFSAVNSRKPTDGLQQVKAKLIGTLRTRQQH